MRICQFCKALHQTTQRSSIYHAKSLFCGRRTLSDASKPSNTPKPSKDVAKHYKSIILSGEKPQHSFDDDDDETLVTLDNIFSNTNKQRVRARMGDVIATPRTDTENVRWRAAVLVPLCYVDREPSFLFMVRSVYLKNHRGEISFPGGMEDLNDRDLTYTALRETYEEIGLPMDRVDVWGQMPPSPSKVSGSWVTPVLGYCGEIDIDRLHLNHSEVEGVFTVPIATICDPANQRQTQWRYPGTIGYSLPVYLGGKYRIWGLTAVVLHQVMTVLAPGLYDFRIKHRR